MSDDERRIEPYEGIVGSGMLTDPERIQNIEAEKARRERAWRPPPEKGFGAVLDDTPSKEHERVGVYVAAPDKRKAAASGDEEDPAGEGGDDEDAAPEAAERPAAKLPPDPRMVALHRQFDRGKTPK